MRRLTETVRDVESAGWAGLSSCFRSGVCGEGWWLMTSLVLAADVKPRHFLIFETAVSVSVEYFDLNIPDERL